MEDAFTLPPLPTGKRGSTFRRMTVVDRLTHQLEVQEQIAVAAGSLAASLQGGPEASAFDWTSPRLVRQRLPWGPPLPVWSGLVFPLPELRRGALYYLIWPLFVGMRRHVGTLLSPWMVLPSLLRTRRWVCPQLQILSRSAPRP